MNLRKIVLLIICCFLLSGCWDHNEPERLLYINGIGVHYLENGEVEAFVQIINLQGLAKQESGGGAGAIKQAEVGRAVGKTMEEAVFNLYHTVDRRMFWGHLSYVILSEDAVKKGAVKDLADFIDRFRETKYRIYFFMTKDSIKDVMLVKPLDNITLAFSKLSDPRDNYKQSSFIEPMNLRELIIHTDEPSHEVHLPVLKVTNQWVDDKNKKDLLMEETAIISNNTLVGIIPKEIYLGVQSINKNYVRDSLSLTLSPNHHVSVITYDNKLKISPIIENDGNVRFNIKIKLKASLQMSKFKISKDEIEKEIKRTMKNHFYTAYNYTRKRNMDAFNLSEVLYRKDNKTWKKIEKNGRIPLEENTINSITIDAKLQNTGRNNSDPLFEGKYNKGFQKRY